jgi:hypothetical protein
MKKKAPPIKLAFWAAFLSTEGDENDSAITETLRWN